MKRNNRSLADKIKVIDAVEKSLCEESEICSVKQSLVCDSSIKQDFDLLCEGLHYIHFMS